MKVGDFSSSGRFHGPLSPASFAMLDGVLMFNFSEVPAEVDFVVAEFVEFKVIVEWRKEQSLQPAKERRKRETHRREGEGGGMRETSAIGVGQCCRAE